MISGLERLRTPALLVDLGRLEGNIETMADRLAPVRLRPHIKTSKCWEVARRQLAAGAIGFTCSTAAEVAWLRGQGVADLVWAHQPVGPAKVEFVVSTIRESGPFLVALDSVEAARPLASSGVTVPYLIEVNTGQGRAGVQPDGVLALADELSTLDGLELRGIMTHEGHLAKYPDPVQRGEVGRAAGALMVQCGQQLRDAGHRVDTISVGSTPGASSVPRVTGVTEARPGTYVYYDANQVRLGSAGIDECALTVLARVVSTQRRDVAIIDAGIKALSSDSIATAGSLGLVCDLEGVPLPGAVFADGNEEHGFLTGRRFAVGDLVRIVPNHACGTTNMFSTLHAIHGGDIDHWPISARH